MAVNTISEKKPRIKVCSKCGMSFPLVSEFWHKKTADKDGFHPECKKCSCERAVNYRIKNKAKIAKANAIRYAENRVKILKYKSEYHHKNAEKLSRKRVKYYAKNKDIIAVKNAQYRMKNKEDLSKKKALYGASPASYETYGRFLSDFEKTRKSKGTEETMDVTCAYCGRWYTPTTIQVKNRVNAINGVMAGESRFYCSTWCQISCPIYRRVLWPKRYRKATSREANPILRQRVLKRDNYACRKCGATDVELHCHHVVPARQNPMTANDPDACITLCKACHKEVHKKKGCKYHELTCK